MFGDFGPVVEAFAEFGDVRAGIVRKAVVREEKARRPPGENGGEGLVPDREIDVGRRRGGKNVRAIVDADSGGIADEGYACFVVEIAYVVRCVAGGVDDVEFATAKR